MQTPEALPGLAPPVLLKLEEIAVDSLARDRLSADAEAQEELTLSILQIGLRTPVEVYALSEPRNGKRWGLISGFRRIAAYARLADYTREEAWNAIPALVREPADMKQALRLMVTENDVRQDISPWEKGSIALHGADIDLFGTVDAAVKALFPAAGRTKAARIRDIARAVEEFQHLLIDPWRLSLRQCLRLANAARDGLAEVIVTAIEEDRATTLERQWALIEPILAEAEETPDPKAPKPREGYPRRVIRPREDLTIRREKTKTGYVLHFTGPYARDRMMEDVLDDIIRRFAPVG